jgi:hypothetical protein
LPPSPPKGGSNASLLIIFNIFILILRFVLNGNIHLITELAPLQGGWGAKNKERGVSWRAKNKERGVSWRAKTRKEA